MKDKEGDKKKRVEGKGNERRKEMRGEGKVHSRILHRRVRRRKAEKEER